MKNFIYFVILILLLVGCMTSYAMGENDSNIIYTNGINKDEALVIAKEYCLNNKECRRLCNISSIKIFENEKWNPGQWIVSFRSKQLSTLDHRFCIFIDKKSGKIVGTEWMK